MKATAQQLAIAEQAILSYIERNASVLRRSGHDILLWDLIRRAARLQHALRLEAEAHTKAAEADAVYVWEVDDVHGNCVGASGEAPTKEQAEAQAAAFCALHPHNQFGVCIEKRVRL